MDLVVLAEFLEQFQPLLRAGSARSARDTATTTSNGPAELLEGPRVERPAP